MNPVDKAPDTAPRRIKRAPGFVEEVFEIIRADIMSLKIPPDTRIPIGTLVKELGVSQTPIREALSMLEGLGLVTRKQFIGYCTAPKLNRKQFEELYEIRLLLEPYAAQCAAERMDGREIAAIVELATLSPKQAQSEYDSAAPEPLTSGELNRLVRRVASGKPFRARKAPSCAAPSEESAVDEEMLVLNRNPGDSDAESLKLVDELRRQALADDEDDDEEDGDDEVRADPS